MVDNQEVHATPAPTATPEHATQPSTNRPVAVKAPEPLDGPRRVFVPMRAQFKVTEISHTTRGVTILYLDAIFDGSIPKENRLAAGNSPKGELSIEVDPKWADANVSHGSTFTLINGPAPGPAI